MRFLIVVMLLSSSLAAQEPTHTSTVVNGSVINGYGDIKAKYPAINRSVYIFEGIYKEILIDQIPIKVVKTDKQGKFTVRLSPTIYTFAILVGGRYVAGNVRRDGYYPFVDCSPLKETSIELVDNSKNLN